MEPDLKEHMDHQIQDIHLILLVEVLEVLVVVLILLHSLENRVKDIQMVVSLIQHRLMEMVLVEIQ